MIKKYLQQSYVMLKQNPLFSLLYVAGTGMAIALVMALSVLYYVKIGDLYPETNRHRMMVALSAHMQGREDASSNSTSGFSLSFIKKCFYPLKEVEAVTAFSGSGTALLKSDVSKRPVSGVVKYTDTAFWKVFGFRFLHGGAFTDADLQSGVQVVVVSDELARRLFGQAEVVGKELLLNNRRYRICGVVAAPGSAMSLSYAQVWVPYTCDPWSDSSYLEVLGSFQAAFLLHVASDAGQVKAQVDEYVRKFNLLPHENYQLLMHGQPYLHWRSLFYKNAMVDLDYLFIIRQMGVWLLLLLLVPALNLSGMITSRMERRLPEMGIRKAFGATVGRLFSQIIWENLLLTLLGGVLGLLLSGALVIFAQDWLLTLLNGDMNALHSGVRGITWNMLFNPILFLWVLLVCVILNLVSALIPAYLALRKDIVYSLNKQK